MEIPKQAKGFDRSEADDDRQRPKPTTDAQPMPTAKGARVRSVPTSIAGRCKDLAAADHAILSLSLSLSHFVSLGVFAD